MSIRVVKSDKMK